MKRMPLAAARRLFDGLVIAMLVCAVLFTLSNNFFLGCAVILLGLAAIPTLFYTCAGAFGELPGWGNILIFFLADALAYLVGYRWLTDGRLRGGAMQLAGFALLWALLFAFVWFTYRTPHLPLFLDPVSGCYGVQVPC